VAYHAKAWNTAPQQLTLNGLAVRLEALTSKDPQTLAVIGMDGRCMTLSVIAPETVAATALRALQTASRPGAIDPAAGAERRTLADVATRLAASERDANGQRAAAIRRWVQEAAEQFDSAPIQAFVPILVEHMVRGRMATSRRATASGHQELADHAFAVVADG